MEQNTRAGFVTSVLSLSNPTSCGLCEGTCQGLVLISSVFAQPVGQTFTLVSIVNVQVSGSCTIICITDIWCHLQHFHHTYSPTDYQVADEKVSHRKKGKLGDPFADISPLETAQPLPHSVKDPLLFSYLEFFS